jgi:predicted transcriptional regulator
MQEFVQKGVATRWGHNHLHTKEQAILELANSEDISTLTYREIADKVGITGKWRANAAWYFISRLASKGLVERKNRYAPQESAVVEESLHPKQQAILSIARSEDMNKLTYAEIADKIGLTGKSRRNDVFYHISYLRKRGLLPASENRV